MFFVQNLASAVSVCLLTSSLLEVFSIDLAFDVGTLKLPWCLRRQAAPFTWCRCVSQAVQDQSHVWKEMCRARSEAGVNCLHVYWDCVDFPQLKILS